MASSITPTEGGSTWLSPPRGQRAPQRSGRSRSRFRRRSSRTCVRASRPRAGPTRRPSTDQSQGVPLATMQELARYWATEYDWRKCEARLNALPQFITEIDGLDIHFIHVRSKHEDALPLIVTHGWPGSVIEQLKIIGPLTDPTAHGGSASDAFHLVIPSMPGYGFSGKPTEHRLGPRPHRARLGRADEAPRLHAVRGAGRRLGCDRRGPDGCVQAARRSCSASTPTWPAWFRPRSTTCSSGRPRSGQRAEPAVRALRRGAGSRTSSWTSLEARRATRSRWRRARRRCTGWRTRPSAWRRACSTTTRRAWR